MGTVEPPGRDVVEPVVIDTRQAICAIGIRPGPVLESLPDLLQLVARGFGIDDVQHASLTASVLEHIEDSAERGLFSASASNSPASRRLVPHSDVPAAL